MLDQLLMVICLILLSIVTLLGIVHLTQGYGRILDLKRNLLICGFNLRQFVFFLIINRVDDGLACLKILYINSTKKSAIIRFLPKKSTKTKQFSLNEKMPSPFVFLTIY